MGTDSVGWAGMNFDVIMKTTNQGVMWGRQTSPIANNSNVSAFDNLKAWAGASGLVHTTDGGGPMTNLKQINNIIPVEYKLFQNYPNPFNSMTIIKFEIRKSSNVKLIIYDIQGKQVKILLNEKLSSGIYSYDWNEIGRASCRERV